jgi:menaquinone-9 beta-reductase
MRFTDPLILGAGPAGSAAAIGLARAGARPLILERTRETHDALCGGFLSWHTCTQLGQLGIDTTTLGGHRVTSLRLFSGTRSVSANLPAAAMGLSRRKLDSAMNGQALAVGAGIERGVAVRAVDAQLEVTLADRKLSAECLFLATGKHDVRGLARHREASDPVLGLRTRLEPHPALTALVGPAIELHLFRGGYAGLVMQEDGTANLCLAVRKSRFMDADGSMATLLNAIGAETPPLGERLCFGMDQYTTDAMGAVPYGWLAHQTRPGLFRLGDQAAVIPSLAGEGIGIALASAASAVLAWQRGGAGAALGWQIEFARAASRPVRLASILKSLAERPFAAALGLSILRIAPQLAGFLTRATRING